MNVAPKLACVRCRREHPWSLAGACSHCGSLLDVEYDLAHAKIGREGSPMERFRDLLPLRSPDSIFDSGEGNTRCLHARELGRALGIDNLWVKVEGDNPTRSVKDRQAPIAIAALRELGVRNFVTASTGNSCTAMARVMARFPDMHMHAFVGEEFIERVAHAEAPNVSVYWVRKESFVRACDASAWFGEQAGITREAGFFFYGKREGLKTVYLEAAAQVQGEIGMYIQAVSSGIGVYAVQRAAAELRGMGLTRSMPRLVCVQEQSCDPMVRCFERGAEAIHPDDVVAHPRGLAKATHRGDPSRPYPYVRAAVLASGGTMVSLETGAIEAALRLAMETEGLDICAASALTIGAARDLAAAGRVPDDGVVLLNLTGAERPPSARGADFVVEWSGEAWVVTPNRAPADSVVGAVIEEVRRSQKLPQNLAIDAATPLLNGGLALDSVGVLELLLALETRFGQPIDDREVTVENLGTIHTLAQLVASKIGANGLA